MIRAARAALAGELLTKTVLTGLAKEIHRLRFDVYCLERGFLDPAEFPDAEERDAYDQVAVQCAALDPAGRVSGTLRLVPDSEHRFPLEAHARRLDPAFRSLPRERTAEISRLVVARDGRTLREAGELLPYPMILFRLFREMNMQSARLGLDFWLAAMEPSLHRLLRRLMGINFVEIGPAMDYFGEVVPYMASIAGVARTLERSRPDLYEYFGFAALAAGREIVGRRKTLLA
jgi:N-acyl-L-homoserine lactone synthetase